jgi:outer membrane protein
MKSILTPRSLGLAAAAAATLFAAPPATAQGRDRLVTVGAGAQAYPRYPGSDSLSINPMPIFDLRREGEPIGFEAPDEGAGFGLLGGDSAIDFGPALQFQGKRRERDVGAAVGNVPFTIEAGAFVQARLGDSFRVRVEARRGLGGHDGWIADVGADFIARGGDTTIFSIGPRLRLSDDNYMDSYFGVTPAVAARTGLAAFDPDAGVHAVGGVAGLRHQFGANDRWGIHAYARYDRLVGDAADSPIVTRFGSRDQFGAGLGLSYTFRIHRGGR